MCYRIERSRTIIPSLIEAIVMIASENSFEEQRDPYPNRNSNRRSCIEDIVKIRNNVPKKRKSTKNLSSKTLQKKRKLNKDYFHDLLFTRKNLKLVHIVCHDKQEHQNKKCDETQIFRWQ